MYHQYTKFFELYEEKKRRARILILGAYRPKIALERLKKLRNCLRERGFNNTTLAMDHPDEPKLHDDPDVHIVLKSEHLIKNWADIIALIYFKANNVGVTSELKFITSTVPEKLHFSFVLIEKSLQVSSLVRGQIKMYRLLSDTFSDDEELCEQAEGYCTNILTSLFWSIGEQK